jgi:hypothetical protein
MPTRRKTKTEWQTIAKKKIKAIHLSHRCGVDAVLNTAMQQTTAQNQTDFDANGFCCYEMIRNLHKASIRPSARHSRN